MIDHVDVWVTADRRKLRPEEMDSAHRVNALHLCLRRTQAKMLNAAIYVQDHVKKASPQLIDELFEDAYDPDAVWRECVDVWPVLRQIQGLVEQDSAFIDRWTPVNSHPWAPVMRGAHGAVVVTQRWEPRITQ